MSECICREFAEPNPKCPVCYQQDPGEGPCAMHADFGRPPHWTCREHGDFDAMHEVGCPTCMRLARQTINHAFQVLQMYGVTKERARTVGNGIEVVATRMAKEIQSLVWHKETLEAQVQAQKLKIERLEEQIHILQERP